MTQMLAPRGIKLLAKTLGSNTRSGSVQCPTILLFNLNSMDGIREATVLRTTLNDKVPTLFDGVF